MVFSVIISGHWLGLRRRKSALGDGQGGGASVELVF